MIYGIGIDIVNVARFERAIKKWGEKFISRLFTEAEIAYSDGKRRPALHLAARFAAKEALIKALGVPRAYKSIEVERGSAGAPSLKVAGLPELNFFLSLTHEKEFAVAQVVIEK